MANIYFCTDVHLGHRTLPFFGYRKNKDGETIAHVEENTQIFLQEWEKTISKRDVIYCLGDMAFDIEHHKIINGLKGRKILVKGNHDYLVPNDLLTETYDSIEGTHKRYGFWISHFPVHPQELWGKKCLCGHVHHANILKAGNDDYWNQHANLGRPMHQDKPYCWPAPKELEDNRYLNICPENTQLIWNKWIISLDEVRTYFEQNN